MTTTTYITTRGTRVTTTTNYYIETPTHENFTNAEGKQLFTYSEACELCPAGCSVRFVTVTTETGKTLFSKDADGNRLLNGETGWHDCAHRADFASAAEHGRDCPAHGQDANTD